MTKTPTQDSGLVGQKSEPKSQQEKASAGITGEMT